jgi:hypothetical protein
VGFHLDHDISPNAGMRVVQMTPTGSACSVVIGEGVQLVVGDFEDPDGNLWAVQGFKHSPA